MTVDIYAHLTQEDYDNEIWKDINGYQGLYQISNMGRVLSTNYNRTGVCKLLTARMDRCGYLTVHLKSCKDKHKKIHRLVSEHFIPNPENKPQVNHKHGLKYDNRATELEWLTASENILHSYENGFHTTNGKQIAARTLNGLNTAGENNGGCKLSDFQVAQIRVLIKRDFSNTEISIMFGVTQGLISNLKTGKVRTRPTPK